MATPRSKRLPPGNLVPKYDDTARSEIWSLEDQWMADRLRGDSSSTRLLVDEHYTGADSYGRSQTRAQFISAVESTKGTFTAHSHSDRALVLVGQVAVSTGLGTLESQARQHAFRYQRVFFRTAGKWRLIASQSTALEAAAARQESR